MKSSVALLAISLLYIHIVNAKALLAVFRSYVDEGKTYNIEWLSDSEDYLELLLVRQNEYGWTPIETLIKNRTSNEPGGDYQWTVPTNLTAGGGYGLWLQSIPINPNVSLGYADLTEWFDIRFANGSIPTSTSLSGVAATTSATGSTFAVNRTVTATAQSANTTGAATHSDPLSRHAIIGIAVGCSVGITLILIVGAIIIVHRRKARTAETQYPPPAHENDLARPSFMTARTLVELPEDPRSGRVEIPGETKYPLEKDGDEVVEEKKTILPEKPIEIG